MSAANPTSYVQEWLSHWPGDMAISHRECDLVPQIHCLDAKDHGDEGVLFQNKQTNQQTRKTTSTGTEKLKCYVPGPLVGT